MCLGTLLKLMGLFKFLILLVHFGFGMLVGSRQIENGRNYKYN